MKKSIFLVYLAIFVFLISHVYGFGLSSTVSAGFPLVVYPGETTEFNVTINNLGSEVETSAKGEIISGNNIAKIVHPQDIYTAQANSVYNIPIRVSIPADTPIGTQYLITTHFEQVNKPGEPGMVSFGLATRDNYPVIVKTKEEIFGNTPPPEKKTPYLYYVLGIIVIVVLVTAYYFWRRSKNQPVQPPQTTTQAPPVVTAPIQTTTTPAEKASAATPKTQSKR